MFILALQDINYFMVEVLASLNTWVLEEVKDKLQKVLNYLYVKLSSNMHLIAFIGKLFKPDYWYFVLNGIIL